MNNDLIVRTLQEEKTALQSECNKAKSRIGSLKQENEKLKNEKKELESLDFKKSLFNFCCDSIRSEDVPESLKAQLWDAIKNAADTTTIDKNMLDNANTKKNN